MATPRFPVLAVETYRGTGALVVVPGAWSTHKEDCTKLIATQQCAMCAYSRLTVREHPGGNVDRLADSG